MEIEAYLENRSISISNLPQKYAQAKAFFEAERWNILGEFYLSYPIMHNLNYRFLYVKSLMEADNQNASRQRAYRHTNTKTEDRNYESVPEQLRGDLLVLELTDEDFTNGFKQGDPACYTEVVKKKIRRLLMKNHPDTSGLPLEQANAKTKKINASKQKLEDYFGVS